MIIGVHFWAQMIAQIKHCNLLQCPQNTINKHLTENEEGKVDDPLCNKYNGGKLMNVDTFIVTTSRVTGNIIVLELSTFKIAILGNS